jgi:hypothetical protein
VTGVTARAIPALPATVIAAPATRLAALPSVAAVTSYVTMKTLSPVIA